MRRVWLTILLVTSGVTASSAWAAGTAGNQIQARHKTGAVTIRGVASHVNSKGFTLQTTTHGTYAVNDASPTQVVEKGRSGHLAVAEGNHVGVRGYIQGRTIRAIQVRVYPVAPKQVSIRGTIARISGSRVRLRVGSGSTTILVTGSTVLQTSGGVLKMSDLRVNDRVDARVIPSGHETIAIHIHVYRAKAAVRHLQVRGIVVSTDAHHVVVRQSGGPVSIALTAQTRYYSGAATTSGSLRVGEQVTVYACCAGHALAAGSVHIRRSTSVVRTTDVRGMVVALGSETLRLGTRLAPTVRLQASTVFELGARRAARSDLRVGDLVSVRGSVSGGVLMATRVHVFLASRKVSTVRGTVTHVSTSSLQMMARGATYFVAIDSRTVTRLSGRQVPILQLRAGDRARAIGHLTGHQLQATSVDVTRPAPKIVTVKGTLSALGAGWLQVTYSSGAKDTVRLDSHTQITFEGRRIAGASLFPGMKIVARGTRAGNALRASSVTAGAKISSETGRLVTMTGSTIQLKRSSGATIRVDLPTGVVPHDGVHRVELRQIGRGAYLHATGYILPTKALRATSVSVLHPTVSVRGILSWQGSSVSVLTTTGESYKATFGKGTVVVATHLDATIRPQDIPAGTTVRISGAVGISGSLSVQTVTVQLQGTTLRAKVESIQAGELIVSLGAGPVRIRLIPSMTISQGSHALLARDIVAGDDVTVYGYLLKGNVVVARKLAVHRRLLGLDGVVASMSDTSFVLTTSDGSHTVLVSSTTLIFGVAGTSLSPGMKVHVSGYLRGDAVILATRVRILKAP